MLFVLDRMTRLCSPSPNLSVSKPECQSSWVDLFTAMNSDLVMQHCACCASCCCASGACHLDSHKVSKQCLKLVCCLKSASTSVFCLQACKLLIPDQQNWTLMMHTVEQLKMYGWFPMYGPKAWKHLESMQKQATSETDHKSHPHEG